MRLAVTLLILLVGCTSAEEIRARNAAADDAQCRELGFKPKTDGYANCRLKLAEIRAQRAAAAAAAYGASINAGNSARGGFYRGLGR